MRVVAAWYERPTELANHLGHIATSLLPACASAYLIDRFSPARGSLYRADTFSFVLEQETLSERGDVLPIEERIASALSWYLARETSSPPLAAPDAATLTEANDLAARHGPRLVVAHVEIDFAPGEGSGARLERFVREAHGFDPKPWPERLRIE